MSNTTKQNVTCKSVCWLAGLVVGAAVTYVMITVLGDPRLVSAVAGIVVLLIVGLMMRRALCSGGLPDRPDTQDPEADALHPMPVSKAAVPVKPAKATAKAATSNDSAQDSGTKLEAKLIAAADVIGDASTAGDKGSGGHKASGGILNVDDLADDAITAEELYDWKDTEEAEFASLTAPTEAGATIAAAEAPDTQDSDTQNSGPDDSVVQTPAPVDAASTSETAAVNPTPDATAKPEIKPMEPKRLEAPKGGTPDDLTRIEGIRADQQAALNEAGIFHYAQIVGMNRRELAWLDQNMATEAGQGAAESWRKQAIQLTRQAG